MTSGVYVLRFPSGKFYIGKADNTDTRFKQHISKLEKGTHAGNMQREYISSGRPILEKVIKIHADHIDLIESMLIEQHKSNVNCLNTAQPKRVAQEDAEILNLHISKLEVPTAQHIKDLIATEKEAHKYKKKYKGLVKAGIVIPAELEDELNNLKLETLRQGNLINTLSDTVDKYKNMSLLKRIFNYNVYV